VYSATGAVAKAVGTAMLKTLFVGRKEMDEEVLSYFPHVEIRMIQSTLVQE
jgi:hypothetical protein